MTRTAQHPKGLSAMYEGYPRDTVLSAVRLMQRLFGDNVAMPVIWRDPARFLETVNRVLLTIPAREERTLRLRFGFNLDKGYTLREIGIQFERSGERIRAIEAKALQRLRRPRWSFQLRNYIYQ